MLEIIGILLVTAGVGYMEIRNLYKKRWIKELWIYSTFLILGLGLSIVYNLHVHLPNPLDWLTTIFKPVHHLLFDP